MNEINTKPVKSGYVMILGLPNVGKSTLMNRLIDEKLAIVTPKPQTTRNRILGIAQGDDHQVLFLDTPGVCRATNELNRFLLAEIDRAFEDADLICFMTEADRDLSDRERAILKRLKEFAGPVFLLINKVDRIPREQVLVRIEKSFSQARFDEVVPLSATKGDNCAKLFELIVQHLPFGPRYFPEGDLSNVTERFLAAEIVREKVFLLTHQEIPYATAVMVMAFKEESDIIRIRAEVMVERSSQKGIVIGKAGSMLKKIGTAARIDLEKFFAKKVYIELFVKVFENWSDDTTKLKELGYR